MTHEEKEWDLKLRKMDSEISELQSRTNKQIKESTYYPMVVASGLTLAVVAVTKLFL